VEARLNDSWQNRCYPWWFLRGVWLALVAGGFIWNADSICSYRSQGAFGVFLKLAENFG